MKGYCVFCMQPSDKDICPKCGKSESSYHAEAHQLQPGTILNGKYLIGSVLGEGGFGITYVGRDITLDMKIAIKEYFPNGIVNRNVTHSMELTKNSGQAGENFDKGKLSFLTEARTLAKFASEQNCVAVRDFFEQNNTAYIVMEYLEGSDLRSYLSEHGKLSFEEVCSLLFPVMTVLGKVHAQGLIHRDISPANIMILSSGTVKLLDFGASRNVSSNGEKSLSILLKPGYAPEEQYRTKGRQGPWTDIYALSATIYKLLTEVTPEDSMNRVFEDDVEPISKLNPSVTLEQEAVVMKGMSVRIEDRYQSVDEMMKAYTNCLHKNQNVASPSSNVPAMLVMSNNINVKNAKFKSGKKKSKKGLIIGLCAAALLIVILIVFAISSCSGTGYGPSDDYSSQESISTTATKENKINNYSTVVDLSNETVSKDDLNKLLDNDNLTTLHVDNCGLTDEHLKIIAMLPKLRILDISGNPEITDISVLNKVSTLNTLTVNDIPQLNLNSLANTNITNIKCAGCDLTDISFLTSLSENLAYIDCSRNKITDISGLKDLACLESVEIYLADNEISDISAFSEGEGPYILDLSGNRISDLSPLDGHSQITKLDISNNLITDINPLKDCFNIWDLDISYNYIKNIDAVRGITDLKYFTFHHNRIESIEVLNKVEKIDAYTRVDASYNNLTNTKGFEAFWKNGEVFYVNISHNKIEDISSLEGIDSIRHLNAADNCLKDESLKTIINMEGLNKLEIEENPITSIDLLIPDENSAKFKIPNFRMSYIEGIDYKNLKSKFTLLRVYDMEEGRAQDELIDIGIYGGNSSDYYDGNEEDRAMWLEKIEKDGIIKQETEQDKKQTSESASEQDKQPEQ